MPASSRPRPRVSRAAWQVLVLATLGFALNFWAWTLLSPLGPRFEQGLGLSAFELSMVVAVPVIVGSLGRIPVGALTDRLGGRVMFPAVSLITVLPVLFIGLGGHASFAALLAGGFVLGIGGTAFAIGIPVVNAWFPAHRRGLALGIYGAGMGGSAIAALTTVPLVNTVNIRFPFLLAAAVLIAYALIAAWLLRDAPGRQISGGSVIRRLASTVRLPVTWRASGVYALSFGGFVAFSVYLPTYLSNSYGLADADAAGRMGGFVLVAVVARPVGGWLSDRLHPTRVLAGAYGTVAACAALQAFAPPLMPLGTVLLLVIAAALGAGAGATFALVALLTSPERVGAVTGFVGAAGGLGGFVPPLLMGAFYGWLDSYAVGLGLLACTALVVGILISRMGQRVPEAALDRMVPREAGPGRSPR
ncbi:NarK/NasA family nitrate transporter [Haloechinothrix sp. YIM 98757]|uniref:NarK/NasA family nitrate transporter n=2 Tax=Haloechinothrix aidingensis TaxID=2752311 RepID=A0A838AC95_9PSEU|nr:MFS transporter [Haloechinothrix aidingensis]MBA0126882.1 NarK/NasA family nitrate transporter [Haloechinothrix aidingensis]